MKKLFYIGLLAGLTSCGPRMYSYKFSMKESKQTKKLYYENDTMSVSFNFYPKGVKMDVVNKSDSAIRIFWDEIKMVENDIEKKVVHVRKHNGRLKVVQPPSLIAPKGKVSDLMVYEYNIAYSRKFGNEIMTIKDMYPGQGRNSERKFIEKLVGTRVTLYLPLDINRASHQRTFNFLLEDIQSSRMVGAGEFLLLPLYMLGGL